MPTKKYIKRAIKPKKNPETEMKVTEEKSGSMIKSDFIDVVIKEEKPKPVLVGRDNIRVIKGLAPYPESDTFEVKEPEKSVESIDEKAAPPHYISERIIGNDQLADIANTLNKRFENGYRFKVLLPLRGNESIVIYEKIMTIEFNKFSKGPAIPRI